MARKEFSEAFQRMTIDQMITLIDLYEMKHTRVVAKHRSRDQSSVLKQLATLNATFTDLCGERLVNINASRGKPVDFTPTGEKVVNLVKKFLEDSIRTIDETRRELGKKLTAASTTGMLNVIARVWPKWQEKARRTFDLHLKQIRTYEVASYLREGKADLVFAGIIIHPDMEHYYEDFQFLEWSRSKVVLLSNHTQLPTDPVKLDDIVDGKVRMILPKHGIIKDLAELIFREENLQKVNVAAWIDDLYFGIGLLRNNIYQACMLALEPAADRFIKEQTESDGIPFYKYEIEGMQDISIASGLFRRKDAEQYASSHPVSICWQIFKEEAERHRKHKGK